MFRLPFADKDFTVAASRHEFDMAFEFMDVARPFFSRSEFLDFIFGVYPKILTKAVNVEFLLNGGRPAGCGALKKGDTLVLKNFFSRDSLSLQPDLKNVLSPKILYEDDFIAIADKPKGVRVHPDSPSDHETLADIMMAYFMKKGEKNALPFHVHRLDVGTSGVIIFAKDKVTLSILDAKLAANMIVRKYIAVIEGRLAKNSGKICLPIGRDRHVSNKYRVSRTGKDAATNYIVKNYDKGRDVSVVELELETGRTHQIRVHLSHIGHPVAGDALYGSKIKAGKGFMLHSSSAEFNHPYTLERLKITSEPDSIFIA